MSHTSSRGLRRELLRRTGHPSPAAEVFVFVGLEDDCPLCPPGTIHQRASCADDTSATQIERGPGLHQGLVRSPPVAPGVINVEST